MYKFKCHNIFFVHGYLLAILIACQFYMCTAIILIVQSTIVMYFTRKSLQVLRTTLSMYLYVYFHLTDA